jgi:hypothetical protein
MIEASHYAKPTVALDTPIVHEILGDRALLFGTAAGFVQHIVDLEDPAKYAHVCRVAAGLHWPLWEDYTPQVFDRLLEFVSGKAPLPDEVALGLDPSARPEAAAAQ